MSHVTRIQTQFTEESLLIQALSDLGHSYQRQDGAITVKYGLLRKLSFKLLGKVFEAQVYEGNRAKMKTFLDPLSQRYAYLATIEKLTEQGFELAEEETSEDQSICLTLRRIA